MKPFHYFSLRKIKNKMSKRNRTKGVIISIFALAIISLTLSAETRILAQTNLSWVKMQYNQIPQNAVNGGEDINGNILYVCRTAHSGTTVPGKVVGNKCNYNWGTVEYTSSNYEILVGNGYYWSGEDIDYDSAVSAGTANNQNYYICRAVLNDGSTHPGRLQNNKCNYGFGGKGYASNAFEILQSETGQYSTYSLLDSALNGNAQGVRDALRDGQAINQKNPTGQTALMLGASKGSIDVVRLLLNDGASIDVRDNDGNTALIYAAWKGFPQVAGLLLRDGANLNARNNKGDTAFTLAAASGQFEIVQLIMNDNAFPGSDSEEGERAFGFAASNGYTNIIRLLLEDGVNIDSRNENGQTALMRAAINNRADVISVLLGEGADAKLLDNNRYTAFTTAAFYNATNAMRIMMNEGGISPDSKEAENAIRIAARNNKTESLKFLIQFGVDKNTRGGENGNTPLMLAALEGQEEATMILINARANVNDQNGNGETALMLAAGNSKKNTLKVLMKAGADINATDKNGKTALQHAISNGHKDTRKELEKAGAN